MSAAAKSVRQGIKAVAQEAGTPVYYYNHHYYFVFLTVSPTIVISNIDNISFYCYKLHSSTATLFMGAQVYRGMMDLCVSKFKETLNPKHLFMRVHGY